MSQIVIESLGKILSPNSVGERNGSNKRCCKLLKNSFFEFRVHAIVARILSTSLSDKLNNIQMLLDWLIVMQNYYDKHRSILKSWLNIQLERCVTDYPQCDGGGGGGACQFCQLFPTTLK
ncbi:hypothetical protein T05_12174 [Trichinella murrelli]|uniref:Uncharacterized protein n=1 Tax=Trichinella murrelli TaxID=144512 RepID=A0A0V0TUP9_9BILA|nr:hypothetical protein T05_12174 [Trichinella murrelli]